MKKVIAIINFVLPVIVFAQKINFSIKINIHPAIATKYIYVAQSYERKIDTLVYSPNSALEYKGTISKPGPFILKTDSSNPVMVWIDSIPVSFDCEEKKTSGKYTQLSITNLEGSDDTKLLYQMNLPEIGIFFYPPGATAAYHDSVNSVRKNSYYIKKYKFIDSLLTIRPHSPIIPFYLFFYNTVLGEDTIKSFYDRLPEDSRNSEEGQGIQLFLQRLALLKKGSSLENFIMKNQKRKKISLYSIPAKYILLDFWASWCGPCRAENLVLLQIYQQYHKKGFEIVSISLDDIKNKWIEAIKKDQLCWYHLSDLKGRNNEVVQKYKITYIPFFVLLDSNHQVIEVPHGSSDLKEILSRILK